MHTLDAQHIATWRSCFSGTRVQLAGGQAPAPAHLHHVTLVSTVYRLQATMQYQREIVRLRAVLGQVDPSGQLLRTNPIRGK
jgi:hypothetical protein